MEAIASTSAAASAEPGFIRRIIVPTDLTPVADVAFEIALDLARRTAAGMDVLNVLGPIEGDA